MKRETISTTLLLCLTAVGLWATYCILEPFLWPILTAVVLTIAFYPLFVRLRRSCRTDSGAALTTVLLLMVAVVVPLAVIGTILTQDVYSLIEMINRRSQESGGFTPFLQSWLDRAAAFAGPVVNISPADARTHIVTALEKLRQIVLSGAGGLLGNVFGLIMQTVIVMVLVYFMLRNGRAILTRFARFILLDRKHTDRLFLSVSGTIQASMYGILTVAVAQAVLMGIGLAVLGVPGSVLWGAVTLFASLVPVVGTALVWLPAALYLFVTAGWMKALGIVVWGALIVGGIDNVLRPLVMKGKVELHPLVLLLALIGGTQVFGVIGIFAGPVILGVTFALLDMVEFELEKGGFLDEEEPNS